MSSPDVPAVTPPLMPGAQGAEPSASDLPPFDLAAILTQAGLEPVPFVLSVWAVGFYVYGVRVLRRRGDAWAPGRTVAWVCGWALFYFATGSGLAAYDRTLLSVHMVQHMLLSMAVPLLLALGAPVTLALRTLPRRLRTALLRVLHSWLARLLGFPPLTFGLFVLSPWLLYFSGWYEATLRSDYLHEAMHLHLIAVGALFLWPMVGVDPLPGRVAYPFRVLMLMLTLPFHAFLGVTMMGQDELIAKDWYSSLTASWLPDPLADQRLAGGLLWGSGDIVGLSFAVVLFIQWVRSSIREAQREDRRLDLLEARAARRHEEVQG